MRFLELHLLAFGPFTDVRLDVSGGAKGLHILSGRNEAGKSTTLRAVRQFLYGFGERAADDFLHSKDQLRIGAEIESDDGATRFYAIRRRGKKRTLRDASDDAEQPESQLAALLAGRDQSAFVSQFGLDHEQLRLGGQAILQGEGDAGQVLFAAASGLHHLGRVRAKLDADMEELFASGSNAKRQLNLLLIKRGELHKQAAELSLSNQEFDDLRRRRSDAHREAERLRGELDQRESERSRLQRLRAALPQIARRAELQRDLAGLADAVVLPADFSARRQKAESDGKLAAHRRERAAQEISDLKTKLAATGPNSSLVEHAAWIQELQQGVQLHRANLNDRPALVAEITSLESRDGELLSGLGAGGETPSRERLLAATREQKTLQSLHARRGTLDERRRQAEEQGAKCSDEQEHIARQLEALPVGPSIEELIATLEAAQQEGNLETRLAKEEGETAAARSEIERATARLRGFKRSAADLEVAPLPAIETIDRAESAEAELAHELASARDRLDRTMAERGRVDIELDQLRRDHAGELPTETDLQAARQLREEGWRAVVEAWEKGSESLWGAKFRKKFSEANSLAEAYESAVKKADAIVDQLRREAQAANRQSQLLAEKERLAKQASGEKEMLDAIERDLAARQSAWKSIWSPLGIDPLSPREMRAWLQGALRICDDATELHRKEATCESLRRQLAARQVALSAALAPFEKQKEEGRSLASAIRQAQRVKENWEDAARRREQLLDRLVELQGAARQQERSLRDAEADLAAWQQDWTSSLTRLDIPPQTKPEEALDWLALAADALKCQDEIAALVKRIRGIDERVEKFEADVQAALGRLAPELAGSQATAAIAQLSDRLKGAQKAQVEREGYERQRGEKLKEQAAAEEACLLAASSLESLCREARVASSAEFDGALERSARKLAMEGELARIESNLRELAAGKSLEEFVGQASGADAAAFDRRLGELEVEIAQLKNDQLTAHEARVELDGQLKSIDGGPQAADLLAEEEEVITRLREGALQYARLKLARVALERGIERFRSRHQGRVVERAGELLRQLTRGSLVGLRTDYDSEGPPQLRAVRAGRAAETLAVGQLSDGTADQLYLAVRLALLEEQLENHESLPLVLDDILIHFDDDRARAALEVLADFSLQAQVLLFTHHERIVELAEGLARPDDVFIHRLERESKPAGEIPSVEIPKPEVRNTKETRKSKSETRKGKVAAATSDSAGATNE